MTDTNIEEPALAPDPAPAPDPADAPDAAGAPVEDQPTGEGMLEHAKTSVLHAVGTVVEKVTDTLGAHKGGNEPK